MKIHKPDESIKSPEVAIQLLKEGNLRYISEDYIDRSSYKKDRELFKLGQNPYAVIVSCSDSRVVPEIFFDSKPGDIFTIRNAGNIIDQTVLGSIEYAIEILNVPLVVICGHSNCGAITAAYEEGILKPHIQSIVDKIQKFMEDDHNHTFDEYTIEHIETMVDLVETDEHLQEYDFKVIGAHFDIISGEVTWINL